MFLSIAGLTKMKEVKKGYDVGLSFQIGTGVLISEVVEDKKFKPNYRLNFAMKKIEKIFKRVLNFTWLFRSWHWQKARIASTED